MDKNYEENNYVDCKCFYFNFLFFYYFLVSEVVSAYGKTSGKVCIYMPALMQRFLDVAFPSPVIILAMCTDHQISLFHL